MWGMVTKAQPAPYWAAPPLAGTRLDSTRSWKTVTFFHHAKQQQQLLWKTRDQQMQFLCALVSFF